MLISFDELDFMIGMGILCILLPILWRRKHRPGYLLLFSIFWVYLLIVVQAVVFPFVINLNPVEGSFSPSINLIPFYFGDCFMAEYCVRGILENLVLTVPFGFGINFLVRVKPKACFWLAIIVGVGFELTQLAISLAFKSGFRAADINDALLNVIGVLLGYGLFKVFGWLYIKAVKRYEIPYKWLLADIYDAVSQPTES